MEQEVFFIKAIPKPNDKTFIDLGAGYGRMLFFLSKLSKKLINIEINKDMIQELKKRSSKCKNSKVIFGNFIELNKLLECENVSNPVLLVLQNTIGTVEGNYKTMFSEIKKYILKNNGKVIISFLRRKGLKKWGINFYKSMSEMVGNPDFDKISYKNGLFVSDTNYISKWWSDKEINEIIKDFGFNIIKVKKNTDFVFFYLGV